MIIPVRDRIPMLGGQRRAVPPPQPAHRLQGLRPQAEEAPGLLDSLPPPRHPDPVVFGPEGVRQGGWGSPTPVRRCRERGVTWTGDGPCWAGAPGDHKENRTT